MTFFNYSVPLLRRKQLNSAPVAIPDSEGQQLVLEDEAEPGSDFSEFRAKSREEVQKRNAELVEAVIPETGLAFGFSVPRTRDNLNLDDPQARSAECGL